jgi:hypothetical protein
MSAIEILEELQSKYFVHPETFDFFLNRAENGFTKRTMTCQYQKLENQVLDRPECLLVVWTMMEIYMKLTFHLKP